METPKLRMPSQARHLAMTPGIEPLQTQAHPTDRAGCPRCNAPVFRISRRLPDLLISFFVPVQRFRCISMDCTWEGVRRQRAETLPNIARISLS